MMTTIMVIFSKAVVLQVSGGEEGKVGTASATPRLPGVSPVVPRIQGGQPPPMQVWDSHEYLCPLCNPYVQPINFRCSGDPSSAPQPLSGCHQTRSPWTGTWNGSVVDLERWTDLRTTTPASDLPVSPPYTAPPPPYLPHCSGSRTIWSNHSKSSLSRSQSLTSGVSLVSSQALSFNAAVAKLNKAALTSQAMSPLQAALNRCSSISSFLS